MKKIKINLFVIIFGIILTTVFILIIFNLHYWSTQEVLKCNSYEYALHIAMQTLEDAMLNIENTMFVECQKDAGIKKIINSKSELENYLAMIRKKDSFAKNIKKYDFLDGMFLYESNKDYYAGETGIYITPNEHKNIKKHVKKIIEYFEAQSMKNQWISFQINQNYYLIRIMRMKTAYVCVLIKPEHILDKFNKQEDFNVRYILCDNHKTILTETGSFDTSRIDKNCILYKGETYNVYRYHSQLRPYSMCMLVKKNNTTDAPVYAIFSVIVILVMGFFIMTAVYKLTGDIILDPINFIFTKEKSEKTEAQLQFLQLQMNPHFINNTLSLIRNLIVFGKYKEAENIVITLSDYTRNILQPDTKVTIAKELEQIYAWYDIQKMRLHQKINLHVDAEPDTEAEKIPTMLIRTFVENSAKHYGKRNETIKIYVIIRYKDRRKDYLDICIRDEGAGFPEAIISQLREGTEIIGKDHLKHIGISNIMKRTKLMYADRMSVSLKNTVSPQGALVRFIIPIQED